MDQRDTSQRGSWRLYLAYLAVVWGLGGYIIARTLKDIESEPRQQSPAEVAENESSIQLPNPDGTPYLELHGTFRPDNYQASLIIHYDEEGMHRYARRGDFVSHVLFPPESGVPEQKPSIRYGELEALFILPNADSIEEALAQ